MAYRDTVKPWFETGDKPTQQQFWTLFDYLRFKDEALGINDVTGLNNILSGKANQADLDNISGGEMVIYNGDGTYNIPSGYLLEKMVVAPQSDISFRIGNTAGGDEIAAEETVTADGVVYVVNIFAKNVKPIYFTGISQPTSIVFFKRKVTLV